MTKAAGARVESVFKWMPLVLLITASGLALFLYRELPWLTYSMFLIIGGVAPPVIRRLLLTPTGIKWDWVLLAVLLAVVARYRVPIFSPDKDVELRFILLIFGVLLGSTGYGMALDQRLKLANEARIRAEGGEQGDLFNLQRDIKGYEAALVLFALGLTLLQMAA